MLYQTVHGKPTFGGYVSRSLPPLSFDAVPGFSQLKTLTTIMDDVIAYDPATLPEISRAVLEVYGANRVVVDKTLMNPLDLERVRSVADGLFGSGARIYEDVQSLAYAVPRADADQRTTIWLDTGWSYLERGQNAVPDRGAIKWRWMADAARVRVMTPKSTTVALKVVAQAFGRVRRVALSIAEHDVGTIVVSPDGGSYETPSFRVPEGTSTITLTSLDGTSATGTTDPRRLSVAVFAVEVRVDE
jgi:hypothetical protein